MRPCSKNPASDGAPRLGHALAFACRAMSPHDPGRLQTRDRGASFELHPCDPDRCAPSPPIDTRTEP